MHQDRREFLSLRHLPGRLNVEEAAWYLGFSTQEIPRLTKKQLLKPLGKPSSQATKVYSLVHLRRLRESEPWLHKASEALFRYWQERNLRKRKKRKS
jgi:hypothetical protein